MKLKSNIKKEHVYPPRSHIEWIGYARALTMLLVVFGHCTYYTLKTNYGGINYEPNIDICIAGKTFRYLVSSIYVFHMPLFAMISGMCFNWTLMKHLSFEGLLSNKFYRLLIPFLFTALFLSIPIKYVTGYWIESDNVIKDIILGQILLGGNSHLWFLMSLFNVFIFSYLIGQSDVKKDKSYYAILFIISVISYKFSNYSWLGLAGAGQLMFFFEIGRYQFTSITKMNNISGKYIIMHTIIFCFLCKMLFSIHLVHGGSTLLILRVALSLYGCFVLIFFSRWVCKKHILRKLAKALDKDSFGMYLFSDPFNYIILAIVCPILGNSIFEDNGICATMFCMRFFITLFISFLITRLVRNLKI